MCSATDHLFKCQAEDLEYLQYLNGTLNISDEEVYVGGNKFYKNIFLEEIDFVLSYIKKQWIFIQNIVLLDNIVPYTNITRARQDINQALKTTLQCIHRFEKSIDNASISKGINTLSSSILPLNSYDDEIVVKISFSTKPNINCPIYEYVHCYLDMQFYILLIRLKCGTPRFIIEDSIQKIMTDILVISKKQFVKECNIDKTPFVCPCIRYFWIILQRITLENYNCDMFWDKLTNVLENDPLFSLWIVKNLSIVNNNSVYKLSPNYNFIKEKLKHAMNDCNDLLKHLKLIYPLICELWIDETRVEILLLLWEHYSKRLNVSNKYRNGHYTTCTEFTESLDVIILSTKDCDEEFEFFIGLLVNYLEQQPKHWGKIKCRLFSQLSPFKIAGLGEIGIYKVFQLFIALTRVNQEEMDKKIVAVLGNLKEEMISKTVINVYMSFVLRHVRENKNVEMIAAPLVKILQDSSENQNFRLIKEFLNGLLQVIQLSNNMQLQQWSLLNTWIIKYLATCYLPDLEEAVKIFLVIVKKINTEDAWSFWTNTLKKNLYPVLKQIGNTSTCPPLIGELVGEICILSSELLNESFNFFNSEVVMYQVTERYLCTVLKKFPENFSLTQQQEKLAVQSWIRICLYSSQNYEEITSNIMKLEIIPTCIRDKMGKPADPLVAFVDILSRNKDLFLRSPELCRFSEMCFENLDRSLELHLNYLKNEAVILRIYTRLAFTFLQCGNLLYNRHKTSSPMVKLLTYLLFPTEFMMGKIVHPYLDVVRKTWHIFFEALLKLNSDNDNFIQKSLRDLISKYIPHYSVAECPIYNCLVRENSAKIILDKMSSIYFKHPSRENELNITKALKILKEYIKSTTSRDLLRIVVIHAFFGLCEVYIFQSQKNLALSIIIDIATSSFYDQLKDEVIKSLLVLTEKHLAFNTKAYFNLINILAKTIPNEISILKESIIDKIKNIERIRGIGHDDNLRTHLNNLNNALRY